MALPVITTFVLLFALLASGAWVSLSLVGVGIGSLAIFRDMMPIDKILAQTVWNGLSSPELVVMPLFILMSELIMRSRFIDGLFRALEPWVRRLPGGLLHTNVLGCTFFALISGSSAATTSAIGKLTIDELNTRGYDPKLSMGSLAGAGTLGLLLPPSITMIVYGVLSQTSVLKLFAAGVIPGLLLATLMMIYIALADRTRHKSKDEPQGSIWKERLMHLPALLPFILLMAGLLISLYAGFASPSEAASISVAITLVIMVYERSLSIPVIMNALIGTAKTTSMLGLIVAAASFLSTVMGYLGLPRTISTMVNSMHLAPLELVALMVLIYILLGCFLEGMSMVLMTLPLVLPLMTQAGYDKVWFGIFLIIVVELAQISPPVGMNLFVIKGLTNENLGTITKAVLPFFLIMVVYVFVLALFPEIVNFLPSLL